MTFTIPLTVIALSVCGCSGETFSSGLPVDSGGNGGTAAESAGSAPVSEGGSTEAGSGGAAGGGTNAGGSAQAGDAASGGIAGSATMGGSTAACDHPSDEICDGVDNNCDGVVDDNCVFALSVVFQQHLQTLGDPTGGGAYTDDCPRGQVLAGVQARMGGNLTQIQGICRELSVTPSASTPTGFALSVHAGQPLPAHPETSTDAPSTLLCGADKALVGLRAALQDVPFGDADGKATIITRLWVSCAKLVIVHRPNGAVRIEADAVHTELAPACASMAKTDALTVTSTTPAGFLPTRLFGGSGLWVDRVGLGVSELQLAK